MPIPEILEVPPEKAVGHFRAKGCHVGFDWRVSSDTAAEQQLPEHAPASLSPGHTALIEATYRAAHLLATLTT